MMNELLLISAQEIARRIRAGEVSPTQAVQAHIDRIERVNPVLNAVVAQRFDRALAEARESEQALVGKQELPPLHGVPFTVKEPIALAGSPWTSGSIHRRGTLADEDATAVARIRKAGAIPLGVTNTSEMAMWFESYNVLYGRTSNPYDPTRIPGGSSGGEGAVIGAGGSPFGVGADIGGSIRMPAFFCGVFGHKPTGGLVPLTGHHPAPHGVVGRYCTVGPLARRAEDLWPLLEIMAGPDGRDAMALTSPSLGDPAAVSLEGARILVCDDPGILGAASPTNEQREATWRAARILEAHGAHAERWRGADLRWGFLIWGASLQAAGGPSFHTVMGEGTRPRLTLETARTLLGRANYTVPALGLSILEKLLEGGPRSLQEHLVRIRDRLRQALEGELQQRHLLLLPTHPRPAPRHDWPLLRPLDFAYTALFNVLELPVTAAPMGLGAEGLPLGVQIAASRGQDHLPIAAAQVLERATGGWTVPTSL
jgi:fatty acid amide hydrolase 2